MPLSRIRTVFRLKPSARGKRTTIRIPQPEERPLSLRKRDVVLWKEINLDPWWYTLHRRGPRRAKIGESILEARAVSKYAVRGTLPERIVYKYLVERLSLTSGIDFDFQSSLMGGRMELGGLVADFIFPLMRMVIQVQGPTHDTFLRARKDVEQMGDLANMGYMVKEIDDDVIYNEYMFEEWMRRCFGLANGMGGSPGSFSSHEADQDQWQIILSMTKDLASLFYQTFGV